MSLLECFERKLIYEVFNFHSRIFNLFSFAAASRVNITDAAKNSTTLYNNCREIFKVLLEIGTSSNTQKITQKRRPEKCEKYEVTTEDSFFYISFTFNSKNSHFHFESLSPRRRAVDVSLNQARAQYTIKSLFSSQIELSINICDLHR